MENMDIHCIRKASKQRRIGLQDREIPRFGEENEKDKWVITMQACDIMRTIRPFTQIKAKVDFHNFLGEVEC